jgi:chromosomal replication initiation ATPase DnaA
MTRATYDTWVKPRSMVKYADGCMIVAVPNQYSKEWWDTRLMTTVTRVLTGIVGEPTRAEFVVWKKKAAAGGRG